MRGVGMRRAPLVQLPIRALHDGHHMAQKVRALSYRLPLHVRVRGEVLTYSISGWRGAV
jgi:hypothetical protein